MSNELTFIEGVLSGDYLINEIDDFVDEWHDSDGDKSLSEFLGMTEEEYKLWVTKGDSSLKAIIFSRVNQISLDSFFQNPSDITWAARANGHSSNEIASWLLKRERNDE